jgi:hypothetical protein
MCRQGKYDGAQLRRSNTSGHLEIYQSIFLSALNTPAAPPAPLLNKEGAGETYCTTYFQLVAKSCIYLFTKTIGYIFRVFNLPPPPQPRKKDKVIWQPNLEANNHNTVSGLYNVC